MMAKLNKTEAIEAARHMAKMMPAVNELSVEQLEAMDYQMRRTLATSLMQQSDVARIETRDNNIGDCIAAFENEATTIWTRKMKTRLNERRTFERTCDGMTVDAATQKAVALLTSMNLRGARISNSSIEVMRGNRDGASLYFTFERVGDWLVNPDDPNHRVHTYQLKINISTCGTSYTPARMALVCTIQQELVDVANELEATFTAERVVSIWGGKVETSIDVAVGA